YSTRYRAQRLSARNAPAWRKAHVELRAPARRPRAMERRYETRRRARHLHDLRGFKLGRPQERETDRLWHHALVAPGTHRRKGGREIGSRRQPDSSSDGFSLQALRLRDRAWTHLVGISGVALGARQAHEPESR